MTDSFSKWFNEIEQEKPLSMENVDAVIRNIPEGEIPPLPEYKKCVYHTRNDAWYGRLRENASYYDGYESAVAVKWHEFRKERCAKCEAILDFKDVEHRDKDWEDHWKMKPLELEITKRWKNILSQIQEKIMGIK